MAKRRCDPYIGMRAADAAVKRFGGIRAAARGMGFSPNILKNWQAGFAPSAFALATMAEAGMDVVYILTGKRKEEPK